MARATGLLGLLVLLGLAWACSSRSENKPAKLGVKYRYLVVSIEAPPDWAKRHNFSIQWQGKIIPLPLAFRIPGTAEHFRLGAGPEMMKYLVVGEEKIPVSVRPDTKFRVGNELGFAIIPEKRSRAGAAVFSLAFWAAVSPPEQPGEAGPDAGEEEIKRAGKKVE